MSDEPPHPLRVLVVEANSTYRRELCTLITGWGHACESAPPGPEAVGAALDFQPDAVLLDAGLAMGEDRWAAARAMQGLPGLEGVVFASAAYPQQPAQLKDFLAAVAARRTAAGSDCHPARTPR